MCTNLVSRIYIAHWGLSLCWVVRPVGLRLRDCHHLHHTSSLSFVLFLEAGTTHAKIHMRQCDTLYTVKKQPTVPYTPYIHITLYQRRETKWSQEYAL